MTNRNLAPAGAAALVVGLFTPIVTMPMVGTINLFNNGTNVLAIVVLILALLAGVAAFNERPSDSFWPGVGAAVVVLYAFGRLQYALSEMREAMEKLKDNPFAGLAQSAMGGVQLQWGWLILAAGAGVIIYAAVKARQEAEVPLTATGDRVGKQIAGAAGIAAVLAIGWDVYTRLPQTTETSGDGNVTAAVSSPLETEAKRPSQEEEAYIRDSLSLYDLDASFFDSMLDGRVPGVDFKIKNNGNRTLNRVTVRVVFQDASGKPIAEDEFNPVWVTDSGFGGNDTPLRPNYIWSQESGKSFVSKSVPSEWAEGKATAKITHIEFAK